MSFPATHPGRGMALFTDLYQITMAYGYWKNGMAGHHAAFHLAFRRNPFRGGYAIAAGLGPALELLADYRFEDDDVEFLRGLRGADGKPLFAAEFLAWLRGVRFDCDVDAVLEGTAVFPHEPLLRVVGPIVPAQLLESALLNIVNFSTLIATKAARVCEAANGAPVLEFGLRRAQGVDGSLTASRAARIGGIDATSNVLAGRMFGIPVRGTHAHSWVMCFENETEAFDAYLDAMPNNAVLLVDTYDTLEGVRNAIAAGERLRARGHELAGIRLDSGDLAWLSREARRMLDEAGMQATKIVASNDLDERLVESLRHQGACIDVWGVGTNLVTGGEQSALGGVYKLSAIRKPGGLWEERVKLSEQTAKTSIPGILQVRRFSDAGGAVCDAIHDTLAPLPERWRIVDPGDPTRSRIAPKDAAFDDLLVPVFRNGAPVAGIERLDTIRERARTQLASLDGSVRRFDNPHQYPAGLEEGLHERRAEMILQARERGAQEAAR